MEIKVKSYSQQSSLISSILFFILGAMFFNAKDVAKFRIRQNECMLLIQKHLTPVRHDRKYPIHLRPKRNRDFVYCVA